MRTPILAVVLGLSLTGCLTIGDTSSPSTGEDDDGGGDGTGNGNGNGNGAGSNKTPALNSSVDKTAVTTELGKETIITLTLTGSGGFSGDATISSSLTDSAGAPLGGGITLTGEPSVTLAANGTSNVMYSLKVPSNATGTDLTGTIKFDVSSSAGSKAITATVAIAAVFTTVYAAGLSNNRAAHPDRGLSIPVKKGAKLRFTNADGTVHITHGDGVFPHESTGQNGGLAGKTYEVLTADIDVGKTGRLGCHSHDVDAGYATFTIQ